MGRNIEVPDKLVNPEAREIYLQEMNNFYKERDAFYLSFKQDDVRDMIARPLGRFCEGGAKVAALERAVKHQEFLKS
jgi:hypothetical protein